MACMEDRMYLILSHTSYQYLIRPNFEQVSIDLGVGGPFPYDFVSFLVGEIFRKLTCSQIVDYVSKLGGFQLILQKDFYLEGCILPSHHL